MREKKGLSTIVTTLMIILLVLVAVGIVWVVVRGVIDTGVASIDVDAKCLELDVRAISVSSCDALLCTVKLKRNVGGASTGVYGVRLIFHNASASSPTPVDAPAADDLVELSQATTAALTTGISVPTSVEVRLTIQDEAGNEQLCKTKSTFNF